MEVCEVSNWGYSAKGKELVGTLGVDSRRWQGSLLRHRIMSVRPLLYLHAACHMPHARRVY